ncbi:helix-turn-helix domain-containing protein [Georgenia sp. H159]|uniref:TetR/AcrR family transcriptional regulator n=1 Tax=Georgenia sp. H159 TaxID=3076115 RepID=UPI002D782C95|nr:helix-turn-helix domain-containing protein [Georgenia sp. H159]
MSSPLSGRRGQAARNDEAILDAARRVFLRDPAAPVSAVAREADVGMSAIYRRFAGKEQLLQRICADGLRQFIAVADEALALDDPWEAFTRFLGGVVDADVHSLTVRLAGTFDPDDELARLSQEAERKQVALLGAAQDAGVVRPDVELNDLAMLLEQLSAVRLAGPDRTRDLRRRYLALHLDALRPAAATAPLPGDAPTGAELGARWQRRG